VVLLILLTFHDILIFHRHGSLHKFAVLVFFVSKNFVMVYSPVSSKSLLFLRCFQLY